jgi:FAD dependent oxidoreductase TIGR03364
MRRADIIVIGAGVLGTFHAYFAARKGLRVLLLERNPWPADASIRNFGMLPQTIVEADGPWAGFARDSASIYRSIQEEIDITVREKGSLYLASTEAEQSVLAEFATRRAGNFGCVYLDAPEVLARFPFVCAEYCRAGLLFPHDLSLDPQQMLRRLIPWITATAGVELCPEVNAIQIRRDGDACVVCTASGETFAAERVIACSGADCRTLFPRIFHAADLRVCKLQMMRTAPIEPGYLPHSILSGLSLRRYPAFRECPSYPALESEAVDPDLVCFGIHLLFKQADDGSVIIGDSHQYFSPHEVSPVAERTDRTINDAILRYARRMLEPSSWRIEQEWNGYYLVHPQEPVYRAGIDDLIHVVTGIAGKGMTTGPGYARYSIDKLLG